MSPETRMILRGKKIEEPSRRVVEVATGMNYWDGQQWQPSDARFEVDAKGDFRVERVQHRVLLHHNLNRANAVMIVTPEGETLKSTPVGIGLYDAESGESLIIGVIKNCQGVQIAPNKVAYQNAFEGVCADAIYTIKNGSFEQDVVLTSNLNPEDYGFPAKTTRIQIFTEFFDGAQPARTVRPLYVEKDEKVRNRRAMPDLVDTSLDFGGLVIGTGKAYVPALDTVTGDVIEGAVAKEFITVEARTLLVESVEYAAISAGLEVLPRCGEQTSVRRVKNRASELAAVIPKVPLEDKGLQAGIFAPGGLQLAKAGPAKGVVVDYIATVSGTLGAKVFSGDTTFFVSGPVFCNGATTIEGGAVFKFPNSTGTGATTAYLQINSTLTCKTTPYRPAVFTSGNDNTIGDQLSTNVWSGYTGVVGTNYYANPGIWMAYPYTGTALNHMRFRYAQTAVKFAGPSGYVAGIVSHSQFLSCWRGIDLQSTGTGSGSSAGCGVSVTLNNCLMAGVNYPVQPTLTGASYYATLYHCTIDSSPQVASGSTAPLSLSAYNSAFANIGVVGTSVTAGGTFNGFYSAPTFGTSTVSTTNNPFLPAGAGNYYLQPTSAFRGSGATTGIPAALVTDIKARTTDGPSVQPLGAVPPATMVPQARRNTGLPDIGYHYDSMDFLIAQAAVPFGGGVYLTNGVIVGLAGGYGFSVPESSSIIGEGKPLYMNRFVWFMAIQEQPAVPGISTSLSGGIFDLSTATNTSMATVKPVIQLRFTDMPMLGHIQNFFNGTAYPLNIQALSLSDCWLRGVSLATAANTQNYLPASNPAATLWNNLIERGGISFYNGYSSGTNSPLAVTLYNNTFWQSTQTLTYNDTSASTHPAWIIRDNLFDTPTNSFTGNGSYLTYVTRSYNAYYPTNATTFSGTSETLLSALSYGTVTAVSWPWYISSSTPTIHDVDTVRTGDVAGLYHYTTSTTQTKEQATALDLGFHYVALSGNLPIDTDGDGVPDYLEDRNGNGVADAGETNWNSYNSPNGIPSSSAFWIYTPLK